MNLSRPPTYTPVVDRDGHATNAWLEYWTELQRGIESPALVAMFAGLIRRRRRADEDNLGLLGLVSQTFRRRPTRVITTTWANRANYTATGFPRGSLLVITDHPLVFMQIGGAWTYKGGGHFRGNLSAIPTLGTADAGLLFEVLDYDHILRWSGSAWGWGTGNPMPSGMYGLFDTAPTTAGWQICDGSTVARLNADGTTTDVTVKNVTTPRYLKGGLSAAAVAGYSGNTPTGSVSSSFSGSPAGSVDVESGSGESVVDAPYTPAGSVSSSFSGNAMSSLELPNLQGILYYRR